MAIGNDGPQKIQEIFAGRGGTLSRQQAVLVDALLGGERVVSYDEIADALWADDPSGGPFNFQGHIRRVVNITRERIAVADIPWELKNHHGRGYQLSYDKLLGRQRERPT